mgnify:CR=1 FL=1
MWPFGKKKSQTAARHTGPVEQPAQTNEEPNWATPDVEPEIENAPNTSVLPDYDPVAGSTGPFDGDVVEIEDFDFSDFSDVTLNLGSIRIPMPKESQVQVEMGEDGPKMVHIVTRHGRFTPVAFAAPRKGGMWEQSSEEIIEGMRAEGMPVTVERGPWGREIVGTGTNGVIRIVGVEGPRWLYRATLAAPTGREDDLAELGRQIIARSFVYRGEDPILAGNSLPVVLPQQLAAQVQEAVQARAAQQTQAPAAGPTAQSEQAAQGETGNAPAAGNPNALNDALRQIMDLSKSDTKKS